MRVAYLLFFFVFVSCILFLLLARATGTRFSPLSFFAVASQLCDTPDLPLSAFTYGQWITESRFLPYNPNASLLYYSSTLWCSLLTPTVTEIWFIGDSQTRHLFLGMVDVLMASSPFNFSASKDVGIAPQDLAQCAGNLRYTNEAYCHSRVHTAINVCEGRLALRLYELWSMSHADEIVSLFTNSSSMPSIVFINIHSHFPQDITATQKWLGQMFTRFPADELRNTTLVWHGVPANQNSANRRFFQSAIDIWVARTQPGDLRIEVLDALPLTVNREDLALPDKAHYQGTVHQLKVVMFLSWYEAKRRDVEIVQL